VDPATFIPLLRRLSRARAGDGVLHLPASLSAQEALQTIRAALKALEPATATPSRLDPRHTGARIHIDGAARGNPGPAGIGVVLVGPDGAVLERIHRYIGQATNNVAEYQALLAGLTRAQALGWKELHIYSDSELLVRQIEGRYQVKHPGLRPLHASARQQMAGFHRVTIQHVPREQNAEADALANRGIDEARGSAGRSTAGLGRDGEER
jgi:ribonuclease HI